MLTAQHSCVLITVDRFMPAKSLARKYFESVEKKLQEWSFFIFEIAYFFCTPLPGTPESAGAAAFCKHSILIRSAFLSPE